MNFRRFLPPEAIRLALNTKLYPEGELPEGFDPLGRQNLNRVREGVIGELCELIVSTGSVANENRLFRDLFNREKKAVTAVGQGIAFPQEGLPFEAPDDEPVQLFFAMAAPPYDDRTYLRVYKSLATLLLVPENYEQFLEAREPSEILRALELVK